MSTSRALRSTLFAAVLPCAFAAPAFALSPITYVSNVGADAGACATAGSACRTFAYAIGQTAAGGEMKAVNAGDFGPIKITKSITVAGVDGATVKQGGLGDAINIAAGATDIVNLIGLEIVGAGSKAPAPASNGVNAAAVGKLTVKNCIIRDFVFHGINFTNNTRFLIEDTSLRNVGLNGVSVRATPAIAAGALHRVTVNGAGEVGVYVDFQNRVSVTESVVVNSKIGYAAGGSGRLEIAHSSARENTTGLVRYGGVSTVESAGNNFFRDNGANVSGAISVVGMQ